MAETPQPRIEIDPDATLDQHERLQHLDAYIHDDPQSILGFIKGTETISTAKARHVGALFQYAIAQGNVIAYGFDEDSEHFIKHQPSMLELSKQRRTARGSRAEDLSAKTRRERLKLYVTYCASLAAAHETSENTPASTPSFDKIA